LLRRLGQQEIELELDGELPTDPTRDREILRIAQEALQNALRHAHADHITLRVSAADGRLLLEVEDDGVGFEPDAVDARSRRLGLTSMEERARRLGGTLDIRSALDAGTTIRLEAGSG
jgi:signal transduction histidine kinase